MNITSLVAKVSLHFIIFILFFSCNTKREKEEKPANPIVIKKDTLKENWEPVFLKESLSFPVAMAYLVHLESRDTVYKSSKYSRELKDSIYLFKFNPQLENLSVGSSYYWLLKGFEENEVDSTAVYQLSEQQNLSLEARSLRAEEIIVRVPINFKPEKVGLEFSQESLPANFWNQKIFAAKWNRTPSKKFYYCSPRQKEWLIIKGTKQLTSDGDDVLKTVELPERTHYFQYYSIILETLDDQYPLKLSKSKIFNLKKFDKGQFVQWWTKIKRTEEGHSKKMLEGKFQLNIISCKSSADAILKVVNEVIQKDFSSPLSASKQLKTKLDCEKISVDQIAIDYYTASDL